MPSSEEISRLRALISRVTAGLGDLAAAERAEIDEAVAPSGHDCRCCPGRGDGRRTAR
jgi:hypothetical protein